MITTIVQSEEFWDREHFRSKFKSPWEFVVSALRVTEAEIDDPRRLFKELEQMGQPLYHCDDPTGWYETAEHWLDPGVMALRWQFASDLASNKIRGVDIPETFWRHISIELPPRLWQHHLTKLVLPAGAGERTRAALSATTTAYLAKERDPSILELGPELLGLLLGSPEFQQQ